MSDPVYRPIVLTARTLFAGLGLRVDVVGEQNIPRTGGAILAINHTSYLDFALGGIPADRVGHRMKLLDQKRFQVVRQSVHARPGGEIGRKAKREFWIG